MGELVSIVLPTFNSAKYIKNAINSVLKQTYSNMELIIIDDSSTDKTLEIVKEFKDKRITLEVNSNNRGPSFSRNKGIKLSKGKWIAFLDSDDYWEETRLEHLIEIMNSEDIQIICDDLYLIKENALKPYDTYFNSRVKIIGKVTKPFIVTAQKMIADDYGYLHPVISREFLIKTKVVYKENLRNGEDFRFLLDCLLSGARMKIIPLPMYYYREHKESLSKKENIKQQIDSIEELERIYFENNDLARELKKYKRKKNKSLVQSELFDLYQKKKILDFVILLLKKPFYSEYFVKNMIKKIININ